MTANMLSAPAAQVTLVALLGNLEALPPLSKVLTAWRHCGPSSVPSARAQELVS